MISKKITSKSSGWRPIFRRACSRSRSGF